MNNKNTVNNIVYSESSSSFIIGGEGASKNAAQALMATLKEQGFTSDLVEDRFRSGFRLYIEVHPKPTIDQLETIATSMEKKLGNEPVRFFEPTLQGDVPLNYPLITDAEKAMFNKEYRIIEQGEQADKAFFPVERGRFDVPTPGLNDTPTTTPPIAPSRSDSLAIPSRDLNDRITNMVKNADSNKDGKLNKDEIQTLANNIGTPVEVFNRDNGAGSSISTNGVMTFIGKHSSLGVLFDGDVPNGTQTFTPSATPNTARQEKSGPER